MKLLQSSGISQWETQVTKYIPSHKVSYFPELTSQNFPYFGLWVSGLRIAEEGWGDKERQKLQSTYLSHKVSSFPELISQISIFWFLGFGADNSRRRRRKMIRPRVLVVKSLKWVFILLLVLGFRGWENRRRRRIAERIGSGLVHSRMSNGYFLS